MMSNRCICIVEKNIVTIAPIVLSVLSSHETIDVLNIPSFRKF